MRIQRNLDGKITVDGVELPSAVIEGVGKIQAGKKIRVAVTFEVDEVIVAASSRLIRP